MSPVLPPRPVHSSKGSGARLVMLVLALAAWGGSACERQQDQGIEDALPMQGTLKPALPQFPRLVPPDATAPFTPAGFTRADVVGITPTERGHAIVLQAGGRALPIFVGESEGLSIQLRLQGERFHRPLTHDLMDAVLEELGGTIESVRVDRYEGQIFYSVIVLTHRTERHELDSRTSDAIALALGHKVPIFVRTSVLDSSSVDLKRLLPDLGDEAPDPDTTPDPGALLDRDTVAL